MRCTWIAIALTVAGIAPAGADPRATDLAREAAELARGGDFLGAAKKFRDAYAVEPKPDYICNVGVAYHKTGGELPRAQLFLSLCLEHGKSVLDRAFLDTVAGVLAAVEEQLAREAFTPVRVNVVPATAVVTVAALGGETFVGSRLIWLPRGKHQVALAAEGYTGATIDVDAAGPDRVTVGGTLDRAVAKPPPPVKIIALRRRSMLPPIATSALTAVAIGLTAYGALRAASTADTARFAVNLDVYEEDRDRVDKLNHLTLAGGVGAIVLTGVSGYLWYRALGGSARRRVAVDVTPAGAFVAGRF